MKSHAEITQSLCSIAGRLVREQVHYMENVKNWSRLAFVTWVLSSMRWAIAVRTVQVAQAARLRWLDRIPSTLRS